MPVPGILSLHVREISRARTRESQKVQEKMTTELPPVLDENTLCHVEAHARSTHSSPSCRDLIKMKRSCPSWLVDRPQTAVLFDAGHGLCCQTLSNQLSCFSGKFFFFPFLGLFSSELLSTGRIVPGSWANHSHHSQGMAQTEGFHWSSM